MTLLVPFDGSDLAHAALVRAAEFAKPFEEDVVAITIIPRGNAAYARSRGWIDSNSGFDPDSIIGTLHRQVMNICPSADFRHRFVERYAPGGKIVNQIRTIAAEERATIVFIGSENAGHLVTSLSSVGSGIAADNSYDVMIVRHPLSEKVTEHPDGTIYQPPKSDFFFPRNK